MLALITKAPKVFAIVVGISAAVALLAVIWGRPRRNTAMWLAASLAIVVISAVGVRAAVHGGPAETEASGPSSPSTSVSPSAAPATCAPNGTDLRLVAKAIAFDVRCLAAPAHSPLRVSLENQDAGIKHSFHVLTASPSADPSAKTLFQGRTVTGPGAMTYHVPPLKPGTYYFQCDVHPTLMNGTFIVR